MNKREILERCREYNASNDLLYYLIRKKETDMYAIIGAPCNYLYQNDENQFFGTCIYVSENNLSDAMQAEFPSRKTLLGIPMVKIAERTDNEGTHSLTNPQIRELPLRTRMDTDPRFRSPLFPAYTCYECEDVIDIIEPRAALMDLYGRNGAFRAFVSVLSERFDIRPEQMGLMGSAALGAEKPGDYDIVFYGDARELRRIKGIVADINLAQGTPKVGGLPLPFRMIFEGRIVDTLCVYDPPMLEGIHSARQIETDVDFSCRVTDDTLALQVEPYLKVDGADFSSLMIAETFFHSVIRKGDIVEGRGDILQWESDGKSERMMFCRDPFVQLKDFTRYFYRYGNL